MREGEDDEESRKGRKKVAVVVCAQETLVRRVRRGEGTCCCRVENSEKKRLGSGCLSVNVSVFLQLHRTRNYERGDQSTP